MYLLHCMWRCNILCSKHDIDMRMNEWNRHALFLSWNGRNSYCTRPYWRSGISSTRERNSASFHLFRYAPLVERRNFSHSWNKSQIFNRDLCKNLLIFSLFVFEAFIFQPFADYFCPAIKCWGHIVFSLSVCPFVHPHKSLTCMAIVNSFVLQT